jgi:transcriptional regulator with XRE-family HTH domain
MSTAARIRARREATGKSVAEVAGLLGVNDESYEDVELHDDELATVFSLSQALSLASILEVSLNDLLGDDEFRGNRLPLVELPKLIGSCLSSENISLEDFEGEVGWQLDQFLDSPLRTALELPPSFLQDLASRLGVDWRSIIPSSHAV